MNDVRQAQRTQVEKMMLSWANTQASVPDEMTTRQSLDGLCGLFGPDLTADDKSAIFDFVTRILSIQMDLGSVIEGEQHKPWLDKRRSDIEWRLWNAYAQYLGDDGRPPLVIDRLNKSLDTILDHMGNPADPEPWERRGLVIGDVQSGKTSTYIGLMNKAVDAGYRIFIILTGNTESLRRQTQERIDEGMIGRDSAYALLGAKQGLSVDNDNRIGVGRRLESTASVASTTTVLRDFRKASAEAMNIVPGVGLSIVFVTKKNKIVLERVADWLKSQMVGSNRLRMPLLFIDDEADYASINTNKEEEDPTAINGAIRDILATSSRNSYIGFTATPFANIFINDEDNTDLFPKDFIYALDAPTNYVGAEWLFGSHDDLGDDDDLEDTEHIRILRDAEDYFPASHKSTHQVSGIPPSLSEALRTYLLANAVRDLRGEYAAPRSMLINISRFNRVQGNLGDWVAGELAAYRNAINSHHLTYARGRHNDELASLQETYAEEYGSLEFGWPEILRQLPDSVAKIEVNVVNSKRDRKVEELELRDPAPRRQISIGGDLLSRGLTLDGLLVSYFYRRTAASDTLMQMGRWFGYRDGYADIFRLWLSAETISNYASTADTLRELRLELERMQEQGLTPQQYGLAVRTHPGALLITARNKMRAAEEGKKSISLRGRQIESASLSANRERVKANLAAAATLLTSATDAGITAEQARGSRQIWRRVPKHTIAAFLRDFNASESEPLFSGDALSRFALSAQADDLQAWDVVLVGGRGTTATIGPVLVSRPERRLQKDAGAWLVSGQKRRVAGPGDAASALNSETIYEVDAEYKAKEGNESKRTPDKEFIRRLERPVLLLYPLVGPGEGGGLDPKSDTLVAIAVAVPGESGLSAGGDQVTYMLNNVAQRLWFPDFEGSYEDEDE